ncbi:efflux RND transporter periplasmic adaptor subunit [Candidatus Kaiserbacteria bacterium]|nr:efflux RND transporter periplasmic adaptor subunit [Candidatus Kaiserbacteria bacterium]
MQSQFKNHLEFWSWKYAVICLVLLVLGGYFYFGRGSSSDATFAVASGDFIQKVSVSGTVVAARDVNLGFAASGRIAGAYAKVGQRVSAGTILAQTENGDLVADLAQAKADLASLLAGTRIEELAVAAASFENAKSALADAVLSAYTVSDDAVRNRSDSLFSNPRTDPKLAFNISDLNLKNTVERGRSSVESALVAWSILISELSPESAAGSAGQSQASLAQVAAFLADANSAINQGLPDSTTSSATLSSYAASLATGRTNVNNAAAALTSAVTALTSAQKNLALKEAGATADAVAAEQAKVANAESALAKTYVVAPFSGIVTRMDAEVGEIVSPSASLISMQSDGIFQIETFVPEVAIAGIAAGNSATTTLDAYGSAIEFPARVVAVDPAETVKDGVPAYKTTLSFLSADKRIRSGMTANVVINIGILTDAIVIPSGAIAAKDGVPYVSVLSRGGEVINRPVVTGRSPSLGQTEILSGLSVGETILLAPHR